MEQNWKQLTAYAVHDDKNIKGFFAEYRFLSNFYWCKCEYQGETYPSSEHAYQAAKVVPNERAQFLTYTAAESKNLWKSCNRLDLIPKMWDARKYDVMFSILLSKFSKSNPETLQKLLDTGDKYLEETNHWGDTYWGVDSESGKGENNLGKILMRIREIRK